MSAETLIGTGTNVFTSDSGATGTIGFLDSLDEVPEFIGGPDVETNLPPHRGLAEHRTPDGTAGVSAAYEAFLPVNERFKEVCTRWQLRVDQPNDHTDAAYDAAMVQELAAEHADVVTGLEPATAASERFARYPAHLTALLDRVRAGHTAFARPMSASYHDVWMELHQDFLLTLGRERAAADGH